MEEGSKEDGRNRGEQRRGMSLTISIRFLAGRAHLHPWQTHHSEGRIEWPPSQWRLLRAIVAVAGRGLTSLPAPDWFVDSDKSARVTKKNPKPAWPPEGYHSLPDRWRSDGPDEIPLSRLSGLLAELSAIPYIWLPKTGGGHTRQYFPMRHGPTGSAVFDTFATVCKDQPLLFHWPGVNLVAQQRLDLQHILSRMTYFGRAESWSCAQVQMSVPEEIDGVVTEGRAQTHWRCVCIEEHGKPDGEEYRQYTLERRLAPLRDVNAEAVDLLPRTKPTDGKKRGTAFSEILRSEEADSLLLRCLLRESGQDITDGLERPIGARWVHYAVPRAIYDVPRPKPLRQTRKEEPINLVRYALNTATVTRPVLPGVPDTLLVADRFRNAALALLRTRSPNLSGHEADGNPCDDNHHASWWPMDEDNDGLVDHVMVWAPGGFDLIEVDALRRLTRLRQRGGRPDLLVTPIFVGQEAKYVWFPKPSGKDSGSLTTTFVSATPYFCPVHLSHGRGGSGNLRPITRELLKGMRIQSVIRADEEVKSIQEFVFDYAPKALAAITAAVANGYLCEPVAPRQFFPVIDPPQQFPPLPRIASNGYRSFIGASLKDPDDGFPFGLSIGLFVNEGTRFIRAASFCRRRSHHQLKGYGRMFKVEFREARKPRPFAVGDQCHYGMGLFVPSY